MEEKRYIYKKNYSLINCLIAFVLALSFNSVSAQEQIVPKLKYKKELKEKGCGSDLNKEGVGLQDKGLDLFFVKGKTAEAVKLLEQAVELEPRLFPSYSQLTFYYSEVQNNHLKAITLLIKGIKHCPKEPLLYYGLADCYARIKQHQDAINNYNKAKELGMEPAPPFFYNLGNSYAEIKEYDKAIENYKAALKLDPKKFDAWRNLVIAYYQKGDKKNAIKYAQELEKVDAKGDFGAWAREAIKQMK